MVSIRCGFCFGLICMACGPLLTLPAPICALQFFLKCVFKMEEALYRLEAVPFPDIHYVDNQPTIDLIEKHPNGIFRLLDSQCKTPKATDITFCDVIQREHASHPSLVRPARRVREGEDSFKLRHYAGDV